MNHDRYDDTYIRGILTGVTSIAVVGMSANANRPSYFVFKYLLERGYRMIAVNPGLAGGTLLGQPAFASLSDIRERVDMVDIFRTAPLVTPIVEAMLRMDSRPRVLWMQLGIRNDEAARLAEDNGIAVVMNRCPKIEYGRLSSEISWIGVNSRTLSSRRAQPPGRGVQRLSLDRATGAGGAATESGTTPENIFRGR
jgi:predicted CoA-binding protein